MGKKESKYEDIFAILATLICLFIIAFVVIIGVPEQPIGNNAADFNAPDQNQNSTLQPLDLEILGWCYPYFLHKYPVLMINLKMDGNVTQVSWQEAERLGYVKKGQEIYMENLDKNGVYCQGAIYYGWREPYKNICLPLEDQNKVEECLNSPITDLNNFIRKA